MAKASKRPTYGPLAMYTARSSRCDKSHLAYQCILNESLVSLTNDKLILTKQSADADAAAATRLPPQQNREQQMPGAGSL